MPRKRPKHVRAEQRFRHRPPDDHRLAAAGLSPAARAEIARIEHRRNDLWPGATASALQRWRSFVHDPGHRLWVDDDEVCRVWECCGDPPLARDLLERVVLAMSRRRRRELRVIVCGLDDLH